MPRLKSQEKKMLQLSLEKEVIIQLKVKAAAEGKSVSKLITELVRSWREVKK